MEPGKIILFVQQEIPQQRGGDFPVKRIPVHNLRRKNPAWDSLLREQLEQISLFNRQLRIKPHFQDSILPVIPAAEFSVCKREDKFSFIIQRQIRGGFQQLDRPADFPRGPARRTPGKLLRHPDILRIAGNRHCIMPVERQTHLQIKLIGGAVRNGTRQKSSNRGQCFTLQRPESRRSLRGGTFGKICKKFSAFEFQNIFPGVMLPDIRHDFGNKFKQFAGEQTGIVKEDFFLLRDLRFARWSETQKILLPPGIALRDQRRTLNSLTPFTAAAEGTGSTGKDKRPSGDFKRLRQQKRFRLADRFP